MKRKKFKVAFVSKISSAKEINQIKAVGFSHLITNHQNIDSDFLTLAKKNHLPVWVEIGCFVGNDLWKKFPLSRPKLNREPVNKLGQSGDKRYSGVIPLPEVVEDRLVLIKRFLNQYPQIKTAYLDFCRFPGRWEDGFGKAIFTDNIEEDISTRQEIISGFVKSVSRLCEKNGGQLGIFLTPYDNAQYGQDVKQLGSTCQFLTPMLYHQLCRQPVDWVGDKIGDFAHLIGKRVLPIIQSFSEPSPLSVGEFRAAILQTECENSLGTMVLSWDSMDQKLRLGWAQANKPHSHFRS